LSQSSRPIFCRGGLRLAYCSWKKKPFDGERKTSSGPPFELLLLLFQKIKFFRRGYIDLRMHEEGTRVD